jgi:predicted GTPase
MSTVDTDAKQRYQKASATVTACVATLEQLLDTPHEGLQAARARLERGKFVLAVVGEFSSGKSFLLNALLEKFRYEETAGKKQLIGLLATDINPSTATITELEYAERDEATAIFEDGQRERIPLDRLNRFIAVGAGEPGTLHDATKDERHAPIRVVVRTNSPFLEQGFIVADTPGLASINPAHRRATLGFLPSADAVLYLIDTQQPFTEGDAAFLGIIRQYIDSMFIVQTKIDLWREPQNHDNGTDNGKTTWEYAYDRISSLAAVHAPGTYVYAVSAREYAEGVLTHDPAQIEKSRFPLFLSALDASLIRRTGRARLRRACEQAEIAAQAAIAHIDSDCTMLALDEPSLHARRTALEPELDAIAAHAREQREALLNADHARRATIGEQARLLADNAEQHLLQAFDTADIARLRDRARLHILVDRIVAQTGSEFAQRVASASIAELQTAAVAPISLNDLAARAFGAEPGTSLWSGDVRAAIAATIVLEAVGGPATGLVHEIAGRFAGKQHGQYMKRELIADLRDTIFPHLREMMLAFADTVATRISNIYTHLANAIVATAAQTREERLGSIDRALAVLNENAVTKANARLLERRARIETTLDSIYRAVDAFLAHEEEIAPADPGAETVRVAHADPTLDPELDPTLYGQGLRPERWRVAVLGALRRGKSSLINAFAEAPILTDDIAGSARFPIHVRYGQTDTAYALSSNSWHEIPREQTISAAAQSPVLRLTPWKYPRELVLVHSPAFDSGEAHAEDLNMVVAGASSAILCLFSRQLSDRELALYERIAELGKPMLFAHTIADNESTKERRNVVELAMQYLQERNIPATRIFTISAHEYMQALREKRAPAGWNEFPALIATIEGQAESHMARLARLERGNGQISEEQGERPTPKPGFFARLFKLS